MTIIVALCGTKQSGKNTLNNFLHGHEMKLHDIINHFDIKPDGKLEVNTVVFDEKGKESGDGNNEKNGKYQESRVMLVEFFCSHNCEHVCFENAIHCAGHRID